MAQAWYAINTKPRKERLVEGFLIERGVEVYLPTIPAQQRNGAAATCPFFPGYLFAHTDLDQVGLWSLHYVPGSRGVVMFGGEPAHIEESFIVALRERLARAEVVDRQGKMLEPGDQVVINSGPLTDFDAVFDRRLGPAGRVRVLVHMLKRWTSVEIDADALRKTSGLPRRDLISNRRS